MDFWRSLSGMVSVELTSADLPSALRRINAAGVPVYEVVLVDDLTAEFRLDRGDYRKLKKLLGKSGERLSLKTRRGSYWTLRGLLRRPVLVLGMGLLLFLSLWVPSRIFFVQVEGNTAIPTRKIIEQAQFCGIEFGATRREVRSEKMKNALLEAIPELQWAGVNTLGCTAVISVRERSIPSRQPEKLGVSSIVAAADGVITEMTVIKGNPVCKVGQAVKAGQVLVSGYTDCGIAIRAEQAQAEIFAETNRDLTVLMPAAESQKGKITRSEKKFSLIIGKKHINFYKGSGISDTSCDKMYSEIYMLLPGGFQLPVALVAEEWIWREETPAELDEAAAAAILSAQADRYLKEQMTAGQINNRFESTSLTDGVYRQYGKYACREMICKTRIEENLPDYAEAD